ncbi:hypothetical protein [Vibrio ziniensis]|uniref:Heat-shock protein n=1 Tax=Vibrio ziniensis TaxID=2711221 RepID=A0A6G7CN15_9VIBR|nr:hypothetical protein [Vibrio ziniensis]QIH43492.1 hypothetical protein G5S32_15965 [Vibrio ziniensis]
MKKYHIQARQHWEEFHYDNGIYSLKHLSAHEVIYKGNKNSYKFVVTYGLHCFAKDGQEHSIDLAYSDGFETRSINLERYEASKQLRYCIENLDKQKLIYETTQEKYFTFDSITSVQGYPENYKVCLCIFKENRLLRIHVTSAFFDRENKPIMNRQYSIFKLAMDVQKANNNKTIPKQASRK